MNMINFDLDKTKLEDPYVDVYYPNGKLLVRTNNEKLFLSICVQIKQNNAEGFYVAMTDDVKDSYDTGKKYKTYTINKNGRVIQTPTNFFKTYSKLLRELI